MRDEDFSAEPLAPPTELVVTTDWPAFRRRRLSRQIISGGAIVVGVTLLALPVPPAVRFALGGGLLVGGAIMLLRQVPHELRLARIAEPLVLRPDGVRVWHQGEYVWFEWTEIEDAGLRKQGGVWFNRWDEFVLVLRESAQARLASSAKPSIAERMFTWGAGDVALRNPCPSPALDVICDVVHDYWNAANPGQGSDADAEVPR